MPGSRPPGFRRGLAPDGFLTPTIKEHSLQKISIHNSYAGLFTTAMRKKWPQLAYLGLYSGAGRAMVDPTGEIIETTAMSVFRLNVPFTDYIFVDSNPECLEALSNRIASLPEEHKVTLIEGGVEERIENVRSALPEYSPENGLLSFCFIDPFSADLDFAVIRELGQAYKMDFLILLMLGRDIRTNFRKYLEDPEDDRIARLVNDPDWRTEWAEEPRSNRHLIRFLLGKFDASMTRLGYRAQQPEESHPIRVMGKGVFLYSLVFYSKDPLGQRFWRAARSSTEAQTSLDL